MGRHGAFSCGSGVWNGKEAAKVGTQTFTPTGLVWKSGSALPVYPWASHSYSLRLGVRTPQEGLGPGPTCHLSLGSFSPPEGAESGILGILHSRLQKSLTQAQKLARPHSLLPIYA